MTQSTLRVPEMSCDACRATVATALEALPGVAGVSVDLETKLVTVEYDDAVAAVAELVAAVEAEGYGVAPREGL